MAKFIMLDVYSGRPNPIWQVDDRETAELISEAKLDVEPNLHDAFLGYRGFKVVEAQDEKFHSTFLESEASEFDIAGNLIGNRDLERRLLARAQQAGVVDDSLADYVASAIDEVDPNLFLSEAAAEIACPPCGGGAAPSYNPGYWNGDPTRLVSNNCYNYANDKATNTFAQPGRASGTMTGIMNCPQVQFGAQSDGLPTVPSFAASMPGVWYVALVIWPGRDYHWYRQDDNGCWSHKPGQTAARNVDNGNNRISDPANCNRGPYTNFCCYMTTKPNANIR